MENPPPFLSFLLVVLLVCLEKNVRCLLWAVRSKTSVPVSQSVPRLRPIKVEVYDTEHGYSMMFEWKTCGSFWMFFHSHPNSTLTKRPWISIQAFKPLHTGCVTNKQPENVQPPGHTGCETNLRQKTNLKNVLTVYYEGSASTHSDKAGIDVF